MGVFRLTSIIPKGLFRKPEEVPSREHGLRVLPIDLGNLLYGINESTFLFEGQTIGLGFESPLIVPYLDALVEWFNHHGIYAIFVSDGMKAPEKGVTALNRFHEKIKSMSASQADYLSHYRGGRMDRALDHLRGAVHHGDCLPASCYEECPTLQKVLDQSRQKHRKGPARRAPAEPMCVVMGFTNVLFNVQRHLTALARRDPGRLAYIGSFTEADDILALLSLYFGAPVLSNDSDFFVHGYGRVKTMSIFQKQFRLDRSAPDGRPTFLPSATYDVPYLGGTLLTADLASYFETTATKMAWLPLIMGCDFGPPDGRVGLLLQRYPFPDGKVGQYFKKTAECYTTSEAWPVAGANFKPSWQEILRATHMRGRLLRSVLAALPEPAALEEALRRPEARLAGVRSEVDAAFRRHRAHMAALLGHLHHCSGIGTLLLKSGQFGPPAGQPLGARHIHDGVLLCLGIFSAGLAAPGGDSLPALARSLATYLTKERMVDSRSPWCIYATTPPPGFPPADLPDMARGPGPAAGQPTEAGPEPGAPRGSRAAPGGVRSPGRPAAAAAAAAATAAAMGSGLAAALPAPRAESGPGADMEPGSEALQPRCQCQKALPLLQPLIQEFFHLPLFHLGFGAVYPPEAAGDRRLFTVDTFLEGIKRGDRQKAFFLPLLPQFSHLRDITIWAPTRPARMLMYALLARGPGGQARPTNLLQVTEHHPVPTMLNGMLPAGPPSTAQVYLLEELAGETAALLRVVDRALEVDDQDAGLDRVLLAVMLLSSSVADGELGLKPDIAADRALVRRLGTLAAALPDSLALEGALAGLRMPADIQAAAMVALGPRSADDRPKLDQALGQLIAWCLGRMEAAFVGAEKVTRLLAPGGLNGWLASLAAIAAARPPGPAPPAVTIPSTQIVTSFSLMLAITCTWLDVFSVLSGRWLALRLQRRAPGDAICRASVCSAVSEHLVRIMNTISL
ncbi:hypothetical protein H696_03362 [Fonticula alba]|uniref:Asteroid domain-containing protein n=1 Tax=Fonticula alba TaxID=691883 RepID=A0A058Z6K8_FONAL|nr:hypothetical protein H696_03362 [Fonticula alba]KCV69895.1 hypothetical protein H696_03362 [Fonticula alba]|eukprot:XP_009495501.1 hypothetical protein H696_03362 [Fonticula alba]